MSDEGVAWGLWWRKHALSRCTARSLCWSEVLTLRLCIRVKYGVPGLKVIYSLTGLARGCLSRPCLVLASESDQPFASSAFFFLTFDTFSPSHKLGLSYFPPYHYFFSWSALSRCSRLTFLSRIFLLYILEHHSTSFPIPVGFAPFCPPITYRISLLTSITHLTRQNARRVLGQSFHPCNRLL